MKIVHIYPTDILNQSRLFKEARYVLEGGIANSVSVLGIWQKGREPHEFHRSGLEIIRIKTKLRVLLSSGHIFSTILVRKVYALISYLQYYLSCLRTVMEQRPDILTCHYVSDLPFCASAAMLSGSWLVYLPHELETERSGLNGLAKWRDKIFEQLFIKVARDVVVVCDPIAAWYRRQYGLHNVHVVRNVPERSSAVLKQTPTPNFRMRFGIPESACVFIYQGMFGTGRGTEELIEAFSQLAPTTHHLILMGFGNEFAQASVENAAHSWSNIHYHEPVPVELITSYTVGANLGLIVSEAQSVSYKLSLPNKFFEYVHAGLPVIVSSNLSFLSSLVLEKRIGWAVELSAILLQLRSITIAESFAKRESVLSFAATAFWEDDAAVFKHAYRK